VRASAFALALAVGAIAVAAAHAEPPKAHVDTGVVVGVESGPAAVFRAIPFAAPPVGPLRWKPPAPAAPWTGERAAVANGPACPQKVLPGGAPNAGGYNGPTSEDCLTLDVTGPLHARHAPVMVWIFGGGNIAGATDLPSYDAAAFARDGVVWVAMNYRLGALGFFAHPALTAEAPGNQPLADYGLMDQIAALKWVKRNIAAFGGDPGNVTIFGESAGGADVLTLMTLRSARGLFGKAIVQSGGWWEGRESLAGGEADGVALASRLGLAGTRATAARLRAVPVEALTAASAGAAFPTVDGRLMTEGVHAAFAAGHVASAPLIIGSNSNEASLLGHGDRPALHRALFNDQMMAAPARWVARRQARRAGAWLYYFSYVPERQRGIRPGTNHASEIPFVFDSLDAVPGRTPLITASERAEATLAHSCWVGFARTGVPVCAGGQAWPRYRPESDQLLEFGDPPAVRVHFRERQLDSQDKAAGRLRAADR